jgi:hypothetical protein
MVVRRDSGLGSASSIRVLSFVWQIFLLAFVKPSDPAATAAVSICWRFGWQHTAYCSHTSSQDRRKSCQELITIPQIMPSTWLSKEINQVSTLEILTQYPLTHITHSTVRDTQGNTPKIVHDIQGNFPRCNSASLHAPVSSRILACMQPCTAHIQTPFKFSQFFLTWIILYQV